MAIGKVIKGESAPDATQVADRPGPNPPRSARPGIVNAEVYEAQKSAQGIIESAKLRAAEIVEASERQAEAMRQELLREKQTILAQAREKGRHEGLASVGELLAKAHLEHGRLLASSERELVGLACKVAEKIIGKDLERSPELLLQICANAIESVRQLSQLVIRVHPSDAAVLRKHRPVLMELIGRVKDLAIKEDAEVTRGGCILETESGTIDAQLSTQVEMIQAVLEAEAEKLEAQRLAAHVAQGPEEDGEVEAFEEEPLEEDPVEDD